MDNIPEEFTVFALAADHRVRMRTTNALERINKESQTPHQSG
jgi:transposase-like protein